TGLQYETDVFQRRMVSLRIGKLDVNIRQFTYPQTHHPALEN
ncbi:hypothetical protein, partial [Escherichia marmotae]